MLAGMCRFHGGVKRQDIGLEGEVIDDIGNVGDFFHMFLALQVLDRLPEFDHGAVVGAAASERMQRDMDFFPAEVQETGKAFALLIPEPGFQQIMRQLADRGQ